jgi:hypothetical protein
MAASVGGPGDMVPLVSKVTHAKTRIELAMYWPTHGSCSMASRLRVKRPLRLDISFASATREVDRRCHRPIGFRTFPSLTKPALASDRQFGTAARNTEERLPEFQRGCIEEVFQQGRVETELLVSNATERNVRIASNKQTRLGALRRRLIIFLSVHLDQPRP